jgi:hypothetical protein
MKEPLLVGGSPQKIPANFLISCYKFIAAFVRMSAALDELELPWTMRTGLRFMSLHATVRQHIVVKPNELVVPF